jgi:HD-GYP domain-containing protein (c-di-GMP phosphodiesterase class II)
MDLEGLVAEARARRPQPMPTRERAVAAGMAVAYLAVAAAVGAAVAPGDRPLHLGTVIALVALTALTMRAQFEIGSGVASPVTLAIVPMLFLAPLHLVPLLVPLAQVISRIPDFVTKKAHVDRWMFALADWWPILGPTLILGLFAPGPPSSDHVGWYVAAIGSEMVLGFLNVVIGDVLMYGTSSLQTIRIAGWAYGIGMILTPVAYMTAVVAVKEPIALFSVVPLLWLLTVFSRERKERYAAALELSQTYRGTVMVLSDVVEADDGYTAFHCRSVVELATAVGQELKLKPDQLQELEIAALLHDVGKIAIPKEILNKPARLTDAEFELMKTHTVEGQALLDRIGGRLARVGTIVRSCHERWDGRGYPDGLLGEEIPLAARIVFCCDAYSAMTTNRPYRKAMPREEAVAELRANAGSQFEPRVVDALISVLDDTEQVSQSYSDAVRAVLAGQPSTSAALPIDAGQAAAYSVEASAG